MEPRWQSIGDQFCGSVERFDIWHDHDRDGETVIRVVSGPGYDEWDVIYVDQGYLFFKEERMRVTEDELTLIKQFARIFLGVKFAGDE